MRGISAVVGLVFFSLLLASVAILYAVYTTTHVDLQRLSEERSEIVRTASTEALTINGISYDGNYLTIFITGLKNGIEVNSIAVFVNHRYVGVCGDLNCADETGNGYLLEGEGGRVTVPYSGPCSVTVTLEYEGSTTSKTSDVCVWTCRRLITVSSTFSDVGYPVHIELNTSNFDFTKTSGNDIRFTDINGTKLPYWIEYWTGTSASIWVKTDVVSGDTNIYMYYCNPSATSESNGYSVFTAFNFNDTNLLAVFHFDEGTGTTTSDATGTYSGTFVGSPTWTGGRYGFAVSFDGASYISTDYNVPTTEFTYLLWVKAYTNNDYDRILYDGNWSRVLAVYSTNVPYIQFSSVVTAAVSALDANWHSLVVKVSSAGGYQSIWVDGVEEGNSSIASVSPRATTLLIGGDGTADFNGVIDELVMFGRVLTSDEINTLLSGYFDFLTSVWVVRKRIDPEPSVTIGPEETGQWVIT